MTECLLDLCITFTHFTSVLLQGRSFRWPSGLWPVPILLRRRVVAHEQHRLANDQVLAAILLNDKLELSQCYGIFAGSSIY